MPTTATAPTTPDEIREWMLQNHREILADPSCPEQVRVVTEAVVQAEIGRRVAAEIQSGSDRGRAIVEHIGRELWNRVHAGHTTSSHPECVCHGDQS